MLLARVVQATPIKLEDVVDLPTEPLSPSVYSAVSSAVQSTNVLKSQSRQLKNEGEKIFPCFTQTDCHYTPLHTGDFLVQYFRDAF